MVLKTRGHSLGRFNKVKEKHNHSSRFSKDKAAHPQKSGQSGLGGQVPGRQRGKAFEQAQPHQIPSPGDKGSQSKVPKHHRTSKRKAFGSEKALSLQKPLHRGCGQRAPGSTPE